MHHGNKDYCAYPTPLAFVVIMCWHHGMPYTIDVCHHFLALLCETTHLQARLTDQRTGLLGASQVYPAYESTYGSDHEAGAAQPLVPGMVGTGRAPLGLETQCRAAWSPGLLPLGPKAHCLPGHKSHPAQVRHGNFSCADIICSCCAPVRPCRAHLLA